MASSSSSSSVPEKTHDPLNSDPPLQWGKNSRRRRSARSSQQNKSPAQRLNFDFAVGTTPLPPPPGFSPRRDCPQHRRHNSPRRDSPADSIDCSAKLSSFIHRGSSSGPFFRRDSESEARRMSTSHSRNYHHQQGSEGSNPYREGGTEKQYEKTTKVEEGDVSGVKRSSKLLIKIPWKKSKPAEEKLVEKKAVEKKPEAKNPTEKKAVEKKQIEEKKALEIHDNETKGEGETKADDDRIEEEDEGDIKDKDAKVDEEEEFRDAADKIDEEVKIDKEGEKNPRIEEELSLWNLRPRKPSLGIEGEMKAPSSMKNAKNKPEENKGNDGSGGEKKKPQKVKLISLNVALTKQEIEEDFFAWSGAKPPRRPQRRAKNEQKTLDSLFPGLSLTRISVDSYKN